MIGNVLSQLGGPKFASNSTVYRDLMNAHDWSDRERLPMRRPVAGDPSTYIRVSSLGRSCARYESIRVAMSLAIREQIEPDIGYTFLLGHHHHQLMQESLVPQIMGPRMRGWWRRGEEKLEASYPDGRPQLFAPPGPDWTYREPYAVNHDHLVHGSTDMVIDWRGSGVKGAPDALEVQEYKSKDQVSWAMIDPDQGGYPDESHVVQAQTYMWLLGIDYGRIVYIKKGERRVAESFVEWPVKRDDALIGSIVSQLSEIRSAVSDAYETGAWHQEKLPKCKSFEKGQAKSCPLRYECHNRPWKKSRPELRFLPKENPK
jgi:hypothetical protein